MRIFTVIIAILLFTNCGGNKAEKEKQWQVEGESQVRQNVEEEEANTINYVFEPAQVKPINEAKENAELQKTLKGLLEAIDNKDVKGLKEHIDSNIKINFGAESGIDNFIKMWELDGQPEKSLLWQELKNAIVLGGTFDEDNNNAYYTPFTFTRFPDKYDAFEYAIITGNKVNIRNTPNTKGEVVRQLSYHIVKIIEYDRDFGRQTQTIGDQTHDWQKIQMADGKMGYVWGKFCRTGIDYRAGFARVRNEGWKMTFFVAGD